ncbi:MAG: hypothetical protein WAU11_11770 [Ignavibacteriaceae bacterium]
MNERKFLTLNSDKICSLLDSANERVVVAAPGFTDKVSARLINCSGRIGKKNVYVIIDDDPEAVRLGYGSFDTFKTIFLNKVTLKKQRGIRIGLLMVDDKSFVYNPTPQIIEEEPTKSNIPNAIKLSTNEGNEILNSLFPPDNLFEDEKDAEIGSEKLTENEIKKIKADLEKRPPIKPELERKIRVIRSHFQFVELELKGASLQNHVFSLTGQDLGVTNKDLAKRIRAQYKLFDADQLLQLSSITDLQERLNKLKKHYLISVPKYGTIIYHYDDSDFAKKIKEFEESITARKNSVKEALERVLLESKKSISPWIKENLLRINHKDLTEIVYPYKIENLDEFIERYLDEKFTTPETLLSNITFFEKVTNVSAQLIESAEFRDAIEKSLKIKFENLVKIGPAVEVSEEDI